MGKYYSLCFHRISDEHSPAYPPIPVKVFEDIIKYLKKRVGFIAPSDIFDPDFDKRKGVLITFDDGFYDFYENAMPVLEKYNVPAVQNIITSCADSGESFWTQKLNKIVEAFYNANREQELGAVTLFNQAYNPKDSAEKTALKLYLLLLTKSNRDSIINSLVKLLGYTPEYTRMMTWEEIKSVQNNNIAIGSHTHSHRNLTLLKPKTVKEELMSSFDALSSKLGEAPFFVAYPNGQYNEKVLEKSWETGFKAGLTISASSFGLGESSSKIVVVPRFNVHSQTLWKNILKLEWLFRLK